MILSITQSVCVLTKGLCKLPVLFSLPSNKAFCGSLGRGIAGIFASCHVAKSKTGPLGETSHTL